ncbi:MAG: hypothetical protein H5T97_01330, partial [Firmicutes bacterium]|nr:hypothetical protein [Bacillota bacterium]
MAGRFSDTYTLKAEVDVGDLDQAADRLRDMADATTDVGQAADQVADDVRAANEELFDVEDAAEQAASG